MNLFTEYKKRHKDGSLPVCHDGVCFFDVNDQPSLIVLTSLSCRSFSTCNACETEKKPNVIVEFFMPGYQGSFMPSGHHHVDPCTDLIWFMAKIGIQQVEERQYKPHYASSPRDLETWLWRFCTQQSRFRGLKPVETDKQLKLVEQMVHAAQKHPKLYQAYYIAYEAFLLNRKYMLFGEE